MFRVGIIIGSTRSTRQGDTVAQWVQQAARRLPSAADVTYEIVDLADFGLPVLDEPTAAIMGGYSREHTHRWADAIASYDAYVFVTPEYNHGIPGALKNAIDFLFAEWNDKAAALVSYGINGGVRAAEHLRLVLAEVKVATVRSQVALGAFTDFEIEDPTLPGRVTPQPHQEAALGELVDDLLAWGLALRSLAHEQAAAS